MSQTVSTGHASFDRERKGQYVGTGNVVSDVQTSSFIRARTEVECNGFPFPEGELRQSDLRVFKYDHGLPLDIERAVLEATENEQAILYRFQHHAGGQRVVHGYVLTRDGSQCHELLWSRTTGPTQKSYHVMQAMTAMVSNPPGMSARVDEVITPATVNLCRAMLGELDDEVASCIQDIARRLGETDTRGRNGDLWRAWMAVMEDRDLWNQKDVPEAQRVVLECRDILDGIDPDTADSVRLAMSSIVAVAEQSCEGMADHRVGSLRVADAVIRDFAEDAPAPTATPGMR